MNIEKSRLSTCIYTVNILIFSLILALFFTGCGKEPDDRSISEITISGIPAAFPANDDAAASQTTYKVYVYASNSMSADDQPVAKGMTTVNETSSGKHTVTISMQNPNPNPAIDPNPNLSTGSWTGEADYFSIMICPNNLNGKGVNAIWVKGGYSFNSGKTNVDWNDDKIFMDFRTSTSVLGLPEKAARLFSDIITHDSDITK